MEKDTEKTIIQEYLSPDPKRGKVTKKISNDRIQELSEEDSTGSGHGDPDSVYVVESGYGEGQFTDTDLKELTFNDH